jgi:hypothetical protein
MSVSAKVSWFRPLRIVVSDPGQYVLYHLVFSEEEDRMREWVDW